jgi:hypothetical protein
MNTVDQSTALHAIKDLFRDYPRPYWVAGGWALDLFAQRTRRPHGDIDVLILARDLAFLAETFTSPRPVVQYAETGEQRPWVVGEQLEPGPHALVFPDDNRLCPIQICSLRPMPTNGSTTEDAARSVGASLKSR